MAKVLPREYHHSDAILGGEARPEVLAAKLANAEDAEVVGGDEELADVVAVNAERAQVRPLQEQIHYLAVDVREQEVGFLLRM